MAHCGPIVSDGFCHQPRKRLLSALPQVIFFDCFNTLIEEHHDPDDFPFMMPSDHLAVEAGFYAEREAFHADYDHWHARNWDREPGREVHYRDRVSFILERCDPGRKHLIQDLVAEMERRFHQDYHAGLAPAPGVLEMLESWRGKARLAVVSNFHLEDYPERVLEDFGLLAHFDFVINSADLGWKKPNPRIYETALDQAGLSAGSGDRAFFVGDNLTNDVLAPRAAGMGALHYRPSHGRPQDDGDGTEPVLASWYDFRPELWPPAPLDSATGGD